ncbi:hypothetical protein [Planococcus halotolerans]|uniref:Uncharacterized protein n=1 Tax=Planococcus halotolerans TaxID=2233542 RepID=A0A365KKS0_9BACL|nr:hypothetical protein [Planococcus halotolerans]RAZ73631.1 hypothetical protein DP120_16990 [Planococcus halotolerans]
MTPDIFNVNSENFVGGPGRLVVADLAIAAPTKISDVMDTTTPYNLKNGWRDLGATNDGISISRGFSTEDFEVDQVMGPADTEVTGYTHSLSTSLAENTLINRQLALVGGEIIETPAELGAAQALAGALAVGARIVTLTTADVAFKAGGWLQFTGGEMKKIVSVDGTSVVLESGVEKAYATTDSVSPITSLPTKRIGYGTKRDVPFQRYALISQKKDGSLYMAVIRKAQVTGDDKEQSFNKSKRVLPLSLTAFPEDGIADEENVYYEIEESI